MQHHDEPIPYDRRFHGGGRHRRGGGGGRHARRVPSFRTAVIVAGTTAAVLTVATGAYVAALSSGGTAGAGNHPYTTGRTTVGERTNVTDRTTVAARANVPPLSLGTSPSPAPTPRRTTAGQLAPSPSPATPPTTASPTATPSAAVTPPAAPSASASASASGSAGTVPEPRNAAPNVPKAVRFVEEIVTLANAEREKAGCGPLRSDRRLRKSAQEHADDMADRDFYAHETPEGRDAGDRIRAAGYSWSAWAENIHRGPKTPAEAMEDWMKSEGHRRNVLNCAFEDIGVGVTLTPDGPWWVQNFGAAR
ncbi:CAP domain-containing protein [Streptomyces sp. NPDC015346]|uniref:CAP domain-containing protein n=1 Tax=Streptomyces sp. NPDC015346 TaxID=3364954 RepID=UPI0036FDC2EA